jgi:hypothetical protein
VGLTLAGGATRASAQVGVSAGVLVVPEPSVGSRQVGPLLSGAVARHVAGIPLYLQASLARTDFTSLDQDYHDTHWLFVLGGEWFPIEGPTRVGVRLGLGAHRESQTVESTPPTPGGTNWIEAVVPGVSLERVIPGGGRLVLGLSDVVLGPWFAVLDPSEYGVAHLVLVTVGLRF